MGCFVKCLSLLFSLPLISKASDSDYACDSSIYCKGDLLDAVQSLNVFRDSKTFVDMPMKLDAAKVKENFENLRSQGDLTKEKLETFLNDNFEKPGQELEFWTPGDWVKSPKLLQRIKDPDYKDFAKGLNDLWKILGRKMKPDIARNPDRYSLLSVPHPFIIPGDRFREFYYWDTYWIIKGLLLSDMHTTAKNMIKNFISMVERFGHVPNGGRIYYIRRSQPPLLIHMMDTYLRFTNDTTFLMDNMPLLEEEYNFWTVNRTKEVTLNEKTYRLSQYNMNNGNPRPEGYREDRHVAMAFPPDQRAQVYKDLASAAESGWDFSTRWFAKEGPGKYNLTSIKTTSIIPVDLNTFLCINELLLAKFARLLGNEAKEMKFKVLAEDRWKAINDVLWNEQDGAWNDLDLSMSPPKHSKDFFASNVYPLIVPSKGHISIDTSKMERVLNYLKMQGALTYPGGVPTSKTNSGQQWDFPNAWPPVVSLVSESLRSCDSTQAKEMAAQLSANWVENNYITWRKFDHMYEKYNVLKKGQAGGGGEYGVQVGFGWTNGVVLEFLDLYGDEMTLASEYRDISGTSSCTKVAASLMYGIFVFHCILFKKQLI